MKEKSGIYKMVSPSGRLYIGQAVDLERRKAEYKSLKCKSQQLLYKSIIKYGFENHTFDIIERCSIEKLHEREMYFIDKFNQTSVDIRMVAA